MNILERIIKIFVRDIMYDEKYLLDKNLLIIKKCLDKVYSVDRSLFLKNKKDGVCERCLVFRFAHYLQENLKEYFVDCDYNASFTLREDSQGNPIITERNGKLIRGPNGIRQRKFVDIIVHKRLHEPFNDFICFEVKKWNSKKKEFYKDVNNLKVLTSEYGYKYGFHLIFGKVRDETKVVVFKDGAILNDELFL